MFSSALKLRSVSGLKSLPREVMASEGYQVTDLQCTSMPNAWQAFTRGGKGSGKQGAPLVLRPVIMKRKPKAFSARIGVTASQNNWRVSFSLGLATGSLCTK